MAVKMDRVVVVVVEYLYSASRSASNALNQIPQNAPQNVRNQHSASILSPRQLRVNIIIVRNRLQTAKKKETVTERVISPLPINQDSVFFHGPESC